MATQLNNQINYLQRLPKEIVRQIALDLSPRDILSLCLTNKFFQTTVCKDSNFWRNKLIIDYPIQYKFNKYEKSPKELYMLFSLGSQIVEIKLDEYSEFISSDFDADVDYLDYLEESSIKLTETLNRKPLTKFIKRGDVLHLNWMSEYRNEGKLMWDGEKVIQLDYNIDEYGSVPQEFTFPEFRPDYFINSISHNNIIRFTEEKLEEIRNNFDINTQKSYVTDRYNKYDILLSGDYPYLKFNKLIINKDSRFEYNDNNIKLYLYFPSITMGGKNIHEQITIGPEWKNAIININFTVEDYEDYDVEYRWEDNELIINGVKK